MVAFGRRAATQAVYLALCRLADSNGDASASRADIAAIAGCQVGAVTGALVKLEAMRLVTIRRNVGGRFNAYHVRRIQ